jgi:hypothetical protein
MSILPKSRFVEIIELMRQQYEHDRKSSHVLESIYPGSEIGLYNNSFDKRTNDALREYFPADETGHCEIEHYCYVLVFGKNGEAYETPEELYDRLVWVKQVML